MKKGLLEFICVACPKVLHGALTLGFNLLLLRYMDPAEYGIYSVCIAGILLVDAIIGGAMDLGVLRMVSSCLEVDPRRARAVERAGLFLKLGLGLSASLVIVLFATPMSRGLFHREGTSHFLYLTCWAGTAMLILRSTQLHFQIRRRFAFYGVVDVAHLILKFGGIALLLVYSRVSPVAALSIFAFAPTAVAFFCLLYLGKQLFQSDLARESVLPELIGFTKWFLLTSGVAAVLGGMDIFMLSALSSTEDAGILAGGQMFAMIPELLGSYMTVVLAPRVIPYCRAGNFFPFFRTFQLACIGGAVALYFGFLFGEDLLEVYLFPESFALSSDVVLILLPGALASMVTFPLTLPFLLFIRPKYFVTLDALTLPFITIAYYVVIERYGVLGAAWVTSSSRFAKLLFTQIVAWRLASRASKVAGTSTETYGSRSDDSGSEWKNLAG